MKNRTFEFLMNRFTEAGAELEPAKHDYASKRKAVFAYVESLQSLVDAKNKLLVCYRTGNNRNAGNAIDAIHKAEATLQRLEESVQSPPQKATE